MNLNALSAATKLDIFSSVVIIVCIVMLAVAADMAAPVLAGISAVGALATGSYRLFQSGEPPALPGWQ
jgi:phage-related minor tail protein